MVSKKSKIVCSVKVSRLEFVSLPMWNRGLQKYAEKVPCAVLLNARVLLNDPLLLNVILFC